MSNSKELESLTRRTIWFVLPHRGVAGAVKVTRQMAEHLAAKGHRVQIAYRRPAIASVRSLKSLKAMLEPRILPAFRSDHLSPATVRVAPYVNPKDLAVSDGDIAIAVGSQTVADIRILKKEIFRARYCHGFLEGIGGNYSAETLSAWSGDIPTIAVSKPLVQTIERLSGHKVWGVIANGVDETEFYPPPHGMNASREGIGTVFSEHPKKDPETVIRAVDTIKSLRPEIATASFGSGPKRKALNVDEYYRKPSLETIRSLYQRSKVWVVGSRAEGFCLPIVEAMLCGAAVVTTDHDTVKFIVRDNENAKCVPVGDPKSLADEALALFDDEERRARYVESGLRSARLFTWNAQTPLMERFLVDIVNGWQPSVVENQ